MICCIANVSTTLGVPSPLFDITYTTEIQNSNRTVKNNTFSSIRVEKTSYNRSYTDATIVTTDQGNSTATTASVSNKFIITSITTVIDLFSSKTLPKINMTASESGTDMNGCQHLKELKRIGKYLGTYFCTDSQSF